MADSAEKARMNVAKRLVTNTISKAIREKKVSLFTTEKTVDDIINKMNLKGESVVVAMMVMNTVLESIAQEIENGELTGE